MTRNPGYGPSRAGRIPSWVKPPAAARKIAKAAIDRQKDLPRSRRGGLTKEEAGRQGITSGVERAKSIARGDFQPAEDIRDFFNRFRGIHADAVARGKAWEDSKVQQAWDLWGGQPMWDTAMQALRERNPSSHPIRDALVAGALATAGIAGIAMGVHESRKTVRTNPETAHVVAAAVGTGFVMWVGMLVWCGGQLEKVGKTYADVADVRRSRNICC